jgi:hypothetical protein
MTEETENGMVGTAKNVAGLALVVGSAALIFGAVKKVVQKRNKSNDVKWF